MKLASRLLGLMMAALGACATAPEPQVHFAPCTELGFEDGDLDAGVDCGWLTVPETDGKSARTLTLAVVRARATGMATADPILYLHGGPGIATLDVVPRALAGKSWPPLRETRDLIFFDQRGTGRSMPALCPAFNTAMDELGAQALDDAAELEIMTGLAQECRAALLEAGSDPAAYNSARIAEDADAVRKALGYAQWNLFATSFGTLPAAEMIRQQPATIRAALFDSAFPPNSPNRAEQFSATAESFAALQRRCDAAPGCRERYGDLRIRAAAVAKRLDAKPLESGGKKIDGGAFLAALWVGQVDTFTAPMLAELLLRADQGDDALVTAFVGVFGASDVFGGYSHDQAWLVNCHDVFPRRSAPEVGKAIEVNPDLAAGAVAEFTDRMCAGMQTGFAPDAFTLPLRTDIPVLVLFGEFDPATPRSDALAAMEGLENGYLAEIDGASHAPFYTDDCTRAIGAAFFNAPGVAPDTACLAERAPFAFADAAAFEAFMLELEN